MGRVPSEKWILATIRALVVERLVVERTKTYTGAALLHSAAFPVEFVMVKASSAAYRRM